MTIKQKLIALTGLQCALEREIITITTYYAIFDEIINQPLEEREALCLTI